MKIVGGERSEPAWQYALAGALLAGGPVWHYLWVNHYPARPEFSLLVFGAMVAGLVGALLVYRVGGFVASLVFAAMLFLFLDLQFNLETRLPTLVVLVIAFALSLLLQRRRALITCLSLGAFYAAALPRSSVARAEQSAAVKDNSTRSDVARVSQPVLLHIILDEHWGVGGLRLEGDTGTANFLTAFYAGHGFELYPAAYSRYYRTVESLPSLVSMGQPPRVGAVNPNRMNARILDAIPYFELLRARGYTIRVFQNSYIDFCSARAAPVEFCETQSGNSVANVGYLPGTTASRFILAARYLVNVNSHVYQRLHPDAEVWRRASVGGALRAMGHLREAIDSGPKENVAYFIHVLIPHRPLGVEANCDLVSDPRERVGYEQPDHVPDAVWREMMHRYGSQVRCAHQELDAILATLDKHVGREHSIVIVHGDHGARIFQEKPKFVSLAPLTDRQLSGRFSTLLAIRRPGNRAAVWPDAVPVQDFVWRIAEGNFVGPVSTEFSQFVLGSRSASDSIVADTIRYLARGQIPWGK